MGVVMVGPKYTARSAESAVIESTTYDEIRALFDEVPEPFRTTLKLVLLDEMPYKEAAAVLGVPTNTIGSQINRGREILKELVINHKREMGI